MKDERMEIAWFVLIETQEDMELAISQLHAYLEEIVLSHGQAKIECWIKKRLPQFEDRLRQFQNS